MPRRLNLRGLGRALRAPRPESAPIGEPGRRLLLYCEGLEKRFGDGAIALDGVSFQMDCPEFVVVLGSSGSGKTTLLRAIAGLTALDAGAITVAGLTLTPRNLRAVRRRLGMVHQEFALVERLTAAQNVLSGAAAGVSWLRLLVHAYPEALQQRACRLIADVGLTEVQANRKVRELSGGQRQRVGVARALIGQPQVFLADEPVANLDPETSAVLLSLLRDAVSRLGVGVLCSLHQTDLACQFADRIIGLHSGKIVFDGPPSAFTQTASASLFVRHDPPPAITAAAA